MLNFSDRTFAQFFAVELGIDIGDPAYAQNGGSKCKRLRYFFQTVDRPTVVRTLNALWHYREALRQHSGQADKFEDAKGLVRRPKAEIDLWPSQIAATTPATDQSDDLVASLPTSAGKTRIAELCIPRCLAAGNRVMFIIP